MDKVKVGLIGCGSISGVYFNNMCNVFEVLDVTACADLDMTRAKEKASQFEGVKAVTVDELLADPDIEIVVNLTIPKAHAEVALRAIEAGKSVHGEKPFTVTREDGRKVLAAAKKRGVLAGTAPDTFMGAGVQTCRKLIDDGVIGDPVAVTAFMMCHGHESWHPDPEFYYDTGGGPMFDMGPYYLTALVSLLGPVNVATGSAKVTFPTRTITSEKKRGKVVDVRVPTHIAGVLDFASGAVGTIITSFDVWAHTLSNIEIHGSKGSLQLPDPNGFGGAVKLSECGREWQEIPLTHSYAGSGRGIGVADMAYALRSGRPHRANGELGYHVLDIMHAIHDASETGKHAKLQSTCERPAALPTGLKEGVLDE
jgi:predicted dehydrogenase